MVGREMCIPSRSASLAPPLPQVANPIEVICWQQRIVILAHGSAKMGSRSVKTFREQYGLWQ
jgi:hypothetical protein